jgi:hypothetical protein
MPAPKAPRRKRKAPSRTYILDKYLTGELEGFHIVMGSMTAREMIRLRSGDVTEGEAAELAASKVVEHDFDVADIRDIEAEDLLAISRAWSEAMRDAALPPTPASN